jgi:hypothetical protein
MPTEPIAVQLTSYRGKWRGPDAERTFVLISKAKTAKTVYEILDTVEIQDRPKFAPKIAAIAMSAGQEVNPFRVFKVSRKLVFDDGIGYLKSAKKEDASRENAIMTRLKSLRLQLEALSKFAEKGGREELLELLRAFYPELTDSFLEGVDADDAVRRAHADFQQATLDGDMLWVITLTMLARAWGKTVTRLAGVSAIPPLRWRAQRHLVLGNPNICARPLERADRVIARAGRRLQPSETVGAVQL